METSDTEHRCYFALNRFGLLSLGALRDALIAKVAQATIQKQQGLQDIYPTAPAALLITLLLIQRRGVLPLLRRAHARIRLWALLQSFCSHADQYQQGLGVRRSHSP